MNRHVRDDKVGGQQQVKHVRADRASARDVRRRPAGHVEALERRRDQIAFDLVEVHTPFHSERADDESVHVSISCRSPIDAAIANFPIQAAISEAGDVPVRVDRVSVPGNVTTQIENELRTCDYTIAVLDYLRPNVLYELGVAHAHGKPAILLNRQGGLDSEQVPFDIYTQQRLEYTELDANLLARLTRMIRAVSTSRH